MRSSDFSVTGNISNYTQYMRSVDFSISQNISNYTQFQRSMDFNLGNISNTTSISRIIDANLLQKVTDFNLQNISNNTIGRNENRTVGNFNFSTSNLPASKVKNASTAIDLAVPESTPTVTLKVEPLLKLPELGDNLSIGPAIAALDADTPKHKTKLKINRLFFIVLKLP